MIHTTRPIRSLLLAASLCGAFTVSLLAQGAGGPPPGGPGHGPHHGPPPSVLFDALDANHDGVISADEMTNAPTSLKALLKNGATDLKPEDLRPQRPAVDDTTKPGPQAGGPEGHPHHGPPSSPLFDALDTNHDGVISADEMTNAPTSLKALLKDGATELKRKDLRPAHPPQHQGI